MSLRNWARRKFCFTHKKLGDGLWGGLLAAFYLTLPLAGSGQKTVMVYSHSDLLVSK